MSDVSRDSETEREREGEGEVEAATVKCLSENSSLKSFKGVQAEDFVDSKGGELTDSVRNAQD